ncbi:hypothetical protein [Microcystis viridis]|nr:hypothetical protein [Microcystis viridis]
MRRLITTLLVTTAFSAAAMLVSCVSQNRVNPLSTINTKSVLAQPNSPLIGIWQRSEPGDPPRTMTLIFNRDGAYGGSYAIGAGSHGEPPAYTEWSGNYRFTGPDSFVFIPLKGKIMVGGIWYYCPPLPNQMIDACTSVQFIAGPLGKQQAGSFRMNGSNQLLSGGETWYRIR